MKLQLRFNGLCYSVLFGWGFNLLCNSRRYLNEYIPGR
jgi:hypothetical protein